MFQDHHEQDHPKRSKWQISRRLNFLITFSKMRIKLYLDLFVSSMNVIDNRVNGYDLIMDFSRGSILMWTAHLFYLLLVSYYRIQHNQFVIDTSDVRNFRLLNSKRYLPSFPPKICLLDRKLNDLLHLKCILM